MRLMAAILIGVTSLVIYSQGESPLANIYLDIISSFPPITTKPQNIF